VPRVERREDGKLDKRSLRAIMLLVPAVRHLTVLLMISWLLVAFTCGAANQPAPDHYTDGFEPWTLLVLLAFIFACALALVAGTIAALVLLVILGLLAGLIAAGMVSASVVIGVLRRSATTGFRALFFQFGGAFGLVMGFLGAWIFILLAKLPMDSVKPWVIGPLLGVVFGLLAAWMFNFAWGRTVEWIARKLPGKKTVEVEAATASDQ
jgi:MFS family permease